MRQRSPATTILVSISGLMPLLLLGGCASTKEAVLPQDGPSMQAIYDAHLQETAAQDPSVVREATFPMYERTEYALPGEVGTPR